MTLPGPSRTIIVEPVEEPARPSPSARPSRARRAARARARARAQAAPAKPERKPSAFPPEACRGGRAVEREHVDDDPPLLVGADPWPAALVARAQGRATSVWGVRSHDFSWEPGGVPTVATCGAGSLAGADTNRPAIGAAAASTRCTPVASPRRRCFRPRTARLAVGDPRPRRGVGPGRGPRDGLSRPVRAPGRPDPAPRSGGDRLGRAGGKGRPRLSGRGPARQHAPRRWRSTAASTGWA